VNYGRIVIPDVVTLPLSEGDTLTVKAQLSSGEERRMLGAATSYGPAGERTFDPIKAGVAKIVAYLVDWTIRDPDGRIVPVRDQAPSVVEAALDMLDSDSYTEILRAIEAHEARQAELRAAKKKTRSGAPTSSGISLSPAAVAGGTNG